MRGKKDDPDQSKRFIETARELGCDEDEAAFDEKLRQIATAGPIKNAASPRGGGHIKKRSRARGKKGPNQSP